MMRRATLRGHPVALLLAIFMLTTCAAIAHVWTQICSLDYGYKLSHASRQHSELLETNRRLRTELAMLKSPARLMELARTDLGLVPPEPAQVRRLRSPLPRQVLAKAKSSQARARHTGAGTRVRDRFPSLAAAEAATLDPNTRTARLWPR